MLVALDYDETFTRDPSTWRQVISVLRAAGHKIVVVTLRDTSRNEAEPVLLALHDHVDAVFFTSRRAKAEYMFDHHQLFVHVWIDDNPLFILKDANAKIEPSED